MNDKEKDELNRWCHTVLLGKCWHEPVHLDDDWWRCSCGGTSTGFSKNAIFANRDYCSSLDLASIVEAKAIELAGMDEYGNQLLATFEDEPDIAVLLVVYGATASAESRCIAARAAVEGEA